MPHHDTADQGETTGTAPRAGLSADAAVIQLPPVPDTDTVLAQSASSTALVVDILGDEDDGNHAAGDLSLREAIAIAQTTGQDIRFDPALTGGVLRLDSALGSLSITTGSFTIDGNIDGDAAGVPDIFISGDSDGNDAVRTGLTGIPVTDVAANQNESDNIRILSISGSGTDVTLASLGLTGGSGNNGGALLVQSLAHVRLNKVTVEGNVSSNGGGGIYNSNGILWLTDSAVIGNDAALEGGGILSATSSAGAETRLSNTTVSGNAADAGGGLYNLQGEVRLANSSFTLNTAPVGSGVVSEGTPGAATTVVSTLIAGNTGSADVALFFGGTNSFTSGGSNLIGVDDLGLFSHGVDGDQVGTPAAPIDAMLAPLALNGGASGNHLPALGSPATGSGADPDMLGTDQSGGPRVRGGTVDTGAVEARALPDLTAGNLSVSDTAPFLGEALTVTWDIGNIGPGAAAGATSGIYLSADATVTTSDLRIGTLPVSGFVTPGTSAPQSGLFHLEGFIAPGTYHLGVIADPFGATAEENEGNNTGPTVVIDLTTAAPVVLDNGGGTPGGFASIARALTAAEAGAVITVVPTNYPAVSETLTLSVDELTLDLAAGITPVLTLGWAATTLTLTGAGAAQVTGNAEANTLVGGAGNDTLAGLAGADTLDGGAGRNTVDYAASPARVLIDLALDTASGGDATFDTLLNMQDIIGSALNDLLQGGGEANDIRGGDGPDNLNGRAGDDTLWGEVGDDLISGGNDGDSLSGGPGEDLLYGNGGNDMLGGDGGRDTLWGGAGNDTLDGGTDVDLLSGQGGADSLSGGGGADTLRGGSGSDHLLGDADNDQLFGNGNNDTLDGGSGNDMLQGAEGSDVLLGGAGADTLSGGLGADRLDGGSGDDVLNGGGADGVRDRYVFASGYDRDRINAFDQAGTDLIELDATLWHAAHPGGLTAQQVVDIYGSLNATGSILTLSFAGGDVLEVQNAGGIVAATLGADILIF